MYIFGRALDFITKFMLFVDYKKPVYSREITANAISRRTAQTNRSLQR